MRAVFAVAGPVVLAPPTPGVAEVLETLHARGVPVVIVSNNSAAAVAAYLESRNLVDLVAGVSARSGPDVDQLKPQPHLLLQAAKLLGVAPARCVMIGDSVSDVEAAQQVGSPSIGYANKPGKRRRFEQCGSTAIIEQMTELLG